MSDAPVKWSCSKCDAALENKQPQHRVCHVSSKWLCVWSEASDLYKNYKRHAEHCPHCSPHRLRQIHAEERADKENRLTSTAEEESSQFSHTATDGRVGNRQATDEGVCPVSFPSLCSPETVQEPWSSWSTDKEALLSYTGMSLSEVQHVYKPSERKLLALAAHQRHRNAIASTITSTTSSSSHCTGSAKSPRTRS